MRYTENRDAEQTLFAGFAMTADIPKPNREKVTKFMKSAGIQVLDDMTIYINGVILPLNMVCSNISCFPDLFLLKRFQYTRKRGSLGQRV